MEDTTAFGGVLGAVTDPLFGTDELGYGIAAGLKRGLLREIPEEDDGAEPEDHFGGG